MKTKLLISLTLTAILVAIIAISFPKENKTILKNTIKNASFLVKNGKIASFDDLKDEPVLYWYFDPLCGSCRKLEENTHKDLAKISSEMPVIFYPTNFLDNSKNSFATNASALLLSTVKHNPDIALTFMSKIINQEFAPYDNHNKTEEDFKKEYISSGGDETSWDSIINDYNTIKSEVTKATNNMNKNGELDAKSIPNKDGEKIMGLPFLLIADSPQKINMREKPENMSYSDYIISEIKKYKTNKA